VDPSEMEENVSDIGAKIVLTTRNQGDCLRRLVNLGKLLRQFYPKCCNEGLLFVFGMLED